MSDPRHIVLLCATRRGHAFLERLRRLCPADELTVVSFPEAPGEPPFLNDIAALAAAGGARMFVTRNVEGPDCAALWSKPVDLLLMVHWRYLLAPSTLQRARLGAVVLHDSLLPAYRGFSPTVWAIVNGEREAGATMLHAAADFDAGDIIDQERVPIGPDDTIADVFESTTAAYLRLLERNIAALREGRAPRRPQDEAQATYTCRRTAEDGRIDWSRPARAIHDLIRGSTRPYAGAFTFEGGRRVTIWSSRLDPIPWRFVGSVPGRVVRVVPGEGVIVLTGDGTVMIGRVQVDDGPEQCAADAFRSLSTTFGT